MTKIAYIRASQQNPGLHYPSAPSSPIKSPIMAPSAPNRIFFQPPMPGAAPMMGAFTPQGPMARSQVTAPKPMLMQPTTRFNSNPTLPADEANGRISKPLMEKRRRARINQCLSKLKKIVVDSAGQYTENNKCKLEKADILELTVKYVKKLHDEVTQPSSSPSTSPMGASSEGYINGFGDCIRQLVDCMAEMPELPPTATTSLQSHLTQCLFSIQAQNSTSVAGNTITPPSPPNSTSSPVSFGAFPTPPSPAPSSESASSLQSNLSPVSLTISQSQATGHVSLKREFSDDDEYEDISEDDEDDLYGPINLSKGSKEPRTLNQGDAAWRPW